MRQRIDPRPCHETPLIGWSNDFLACARGADPSASLTPKRDMSAHAGR
jgi:hypothetical protein